MFFFGYLFSKFQKNRSQKLSLLEQKQRQIWNLHEIPQKVMKPNFSIFVLLFLWSKISQQKYFFFQKYWFFWTLTCNKKILAQKIEDQASYLCAEFDADSKTVFVFILALIVFDFSSFEGSKNTFYRKGKCVYIYAYIAYYYLIKGPYVLVWYLSLHALFYILFFL